MPKNKKEGNLRLEKSGPASEPLPQVDDEPPKPLNRTSTAIAAYYLRAQMFTCVPRQIRDDMEWMAGIGTTYVCVGVLEQDLFAGHQNHALIAEEAARVGMRIVAVPSRWAGLTAGAPKVPSLFSILNPKTWMVHKKHTTAISPHTSGAISSVHHPRTLKFFCDTLAEMYRQHPAMAGFIIDEPKGFQIDHSKMARDALGKKAPESAHFAAARDFYGKVCAFAKKRWPEKFTVLFQQAHSPAGDHLTAGAAVPHLDYYGCDGRPWTLEDDEKMEGGGADQESGHGKVLLSGTGEWFINAARAAAGRKSFLLVENHNLRSSMIEPMDRNLPAVLALRPDMAAYYYYPRNVEEADRAMAVIAKHVKAFTQAKVDKTAPPKPAAEPKKEGVKS